jgi:hypothetical protein
MQTSHTCTALRAAIQSTRNRDDKALLIQLVAIVNAAATNPYMDGHASALAALVDTNAHYVLTPAQLLVRVLTDLDDASLGYALTDLRDGTSLCETKVGRFNHCDVTGSKSVRMGVKADLMTPHYVRIGWQTPVYTHNGWVQSSLLDILTINEWYNLRHNARRPAFAVSYNSIDKKGRKWPMVQAIDAATGKMVLEEYAKTSTEALRLVKRALKERKTGHFLMPDFVIVGKDLVQS